MKLHVDLETFELIEGPGFRNPVTTLRFKRGDAAKLEMVFLRNGTTATTIGDPGQLEMRFGVKPRNRYDVGYLVHTAEWTMPAPDAENPVYQCSPSFNTVELNAALNLGSSTATELSEITLMGEVTWREGSGEPTSTRTFLVIVENDVNRGTEGVPSSAEPPYPEPQNIASPADVAAVMAVMTDHLNATDPHPNYLRHDEQEALTTQQQENVRNAILAAEMSPNPAMPMQNINGTWYPAVFDGQPQNYNPNQMIDGTPGWKGRIAISGTEAWLSTKDDMTTANDGWVGVSANYPPPQINMVTINSYESWTSFGMIEAGKNYRVRFDNFTAIPQSGDSFGITYVNYGMASVSNVQLVSSSYLSAIIDSGANFMAAHDGMAGYASEIYAEFTFTADSPFDWAGYSYFGMTYSGYEVSLTVTITEI